MYKYLSKYVVAVALALSFPFVYAAQLVNINTADAVTIAENLSGIGASKAQAIIEYRKLHGEFKSTEDLVKVKGIGFKLVERNSALISFGEGSVNNTETTEVVNQAKTLLNPQSDSQALSPSN